MPKATLPIQATQQSKAATKSPPRTALGVQLENFRSLAHSIAHPALRHVVSSFRTTAKSKRLYALDMFAVMAAVVLATAFRLGPLSLWSNKVQVETLLTSIPIHVAVCAVVFPLAGLYKRNWRYGTISDLMSIILAASATTLFFIALMFFTTRADSVPRSVLLIELVLLVGFLSSARLGFRIDDIGDFRSAFVTKGRSVEDSIPVLLVGAGDAADIYLRALKRDNGSGYLPVGFLDSSGQQEGLMMRGVPILGSLENFASVVADLKQMGRFPRRIIFTDTIQALGQASCEALIEQADKLGIAVSRLSRPTELRAPFAGERFELKPIELTDLLARPQTALDHSALKRLLFGRRVAITGAGGSIGSELTKQIASYEPGEIVLVENCEYNLYDIDMQLGEKFAGVKRSSYLCDVRNMSRVTEIFEKHRPELVFHAAALKHVPMVELNPCEGFLTNVIGTMNVADASKKAGALAMVEISTDKAVNPTSFMGASKRVAELYCQALDLEGARTGQSPRFMSVRFGNVLGSSGSLIPLFKKQLAHGGPLTVTDENMTRFFMTIREAVELTLQACSYGLEKCVGQGEIFVLEMGKPVKVIDIARRMIRLAGYVPDEDIKIKFIGCRPGEKLYEELFDAREKRVSSPVPGVLGAVPSPIPLNVLERELARMHEFAASGDEYGLFKAIKKLIPGFRHEAPKSSRRSASAHDHDAKAERKTVISVAGKTFTYARARETVEPAVRWPVYDSEQINDVVDVLKAGTVNAWTGPHVKNFENEYARHLGVNHTIGVANGTLALDLALYAVGLSQGDEVIVTPRSFIASASCVPFAGGVPVFADVDLDSQNLSAATIAPKLTSKTKGIIAVHLAGWPCDMPSIMELARKHDLWVIEDCAQAHGAELDGRPVGTFGDIAAFSFCQDKIITTGGEGGLLAMNDETLWKKAWSRKDHGKSYDTVFNTHHPAGFRWLHEEFGTNFRMTSVQAALGLRQLKRLPDWTAQRARNANILAAATSDLPALRTPLPSGDITHAWYRFYTFVRPERLKEGWNRDRIMAEINAQGTACYSGSCSEIYLEKAFKNWDGTRNIAPLPQAKLLGETSLAFLVDPTLSVPRMEAAAETIRRVVNDATA